MKIIKNDIMKSDAHIIVYLSQGEVVEQLKREHPAIYNWVFPRTPLPPGSMIKTGASPTQGHIVLFAADEYGGIKASDMYECFKSFKEYVKDYGVNEEDIAITEELYRVIKNKDYIKE